MEIASRIALARKKLNITQQQLADTLQLSLSAIKKYETGVRRPKDSIKVKMAKALNTNVQDLFY